MTPFALRRRMAHGNIYPPEKIDAALANYFREGNLGALRELALLWMADRVDEALQDYMRDHGIEGPWETRERILVGVSGRAEDEPLIRRAARMATRRGGELLAVHVIPEDGPRRRPGPGRDAEARRDGRRVVPRGGRPQHARGAARLRACGERHAGRAGRQQPAAMPTAAPRRPSINRVIRDSGPIDVHVISMSETPPHAAAAGARRSEGCPRGAARTVRCSRSITLPLLTVLLTAFRDRVGVSTVLLMYLLIVVGTAAIGGLWPALAAAVASSLLTNYYFVPPIHTLDDRGAASICSRSSCSSRSRPW